MVRCFFALATLASLAVPAAVQAQAQPVVVELYTSQGCSSCPPADALIEELADRSDVLALALHVDYWDYIGWTDTFAQADFTRRQKGYAKAAGHRSIYTPQMVIDGTDHVVGYRPMELAELIDRHRDAVPEAQIALAREGTGLAITVTPGAGAAGRYVLQLVRFDPEQTVTIERGENAGMTIDYVNIVTAWTRLAEWDGAAPLSLQAELPGSAATAVILQRQDFGPIVAAAVLK